MTFRISRILYRSRDQRTPSEREYTSLLMRFAVMKAARMFLEVQKYASPRISASVPLRRIKVNLLGEHRRRLLYRHHNDITRNQQGNDTHTGSRVAKYNSLRV